MSGYAFRGSSTFEIETRKGDNFSKRPLKGNPVVATHLPNLVRKAPTVKGHAGVSLGQQDVSLLKDPYGYWIWLDESLIRAWCIEYRSDDVTKNFFLDFSVLDTMYRWSMMKNIHSPNWVGIGSWGPEIWPHDYLISPIEISVNCSGSKQLWTRLIYTDFNEDN